MVRHKQKMQNVNSSHKQAVLETYFKIISKPTVDKHTTIMDTVENKTNKNDNKKSKVKKSQKNNSKSNLNQNVEIDEFIIQPRKLPYPIHSFESDSENEEVPLKICRYSINQDNRKNDGVTLNNNFSDKAVQSSAINDSELCQNTYLSSKKFSLNRVERIIAINKPVAVKFTSSLEKEKPRILQESQCTLNFDKDSAGTTETNLDQEAKLIDSNKTNDQRNKSDQLLSTTNFAMQNNLSTTTENEIISNSSLTVNNTSICNSDTKPNIEAIPIQISQSEVICISDSDSSNDTVIFPRNTNAESNINSTRSDMLDEPSASSSKLVVILENKTISPKTNEKSMEKTNKKSMEKITDLQASTNHNNESSDSDHEPTTSSTSKKRKTKSKDSEYEDELDDEDLNFKCVKHFKEIVKTNSSTGNLSMLLSENEKNALEKFMNINNLCYQIFCHKLFTRLPRWYNIFKLCNSMKLFMSDTAIRKMYNDLKSIGFIRTDYKQEPIHKLLNYLRTPVLQELCKSFKLRMVKKRRADLITLLLTNTSTQSTLSSKSTDDILKERVYEKMGFCVKLSDSLFYAFHHMHVLYSFTNPELQKPNDLYFFMDKIHNGSIIFPDYNIDPVPLFLTEQDFLRFSKGYECKMELIKCIENKENLNIHELCKFAYKNLKDIINEGSIHVVQPFLKRFTAGSKYASVLTIGAKHLSATYPEDVKNWLHLLLEQTVYCQHKRGFWYDQLVMIQTKHSNSLSEGVKTLIKGLEDETISEVDRYSLSRRGSALKNSHRVKIEQLFQDKIAFLVMPDIDNFPENEVDACAVRSEIVGRKRKYEIREKNGDRIFVSVEEFAIHSYRRYGFSGIHCESALLTNLFFTLFWDIIYESKVEGAFINDVQIVPLDLCTEYFYKNRKTAIDLRLEEINSAWDDVEMKSFVYKIWCEQSHKKTFINDTFINDERQLYEIILCIGRDKLSKILQRLVMNFGLYRSGLPDLFLWNFKEKKCKFVEVKGENDRLSVTQKLWLDFLRSVGVDIEVCYIHSKGSKRKNIKAKKDIKVKINKK